MKSTFLSYFLPFLFFFLSSCTHREAQMREVLLQAKEQNQAYIPFTSDSVLRQAADYYDRHGTPNDRLLARYLLGCVYRDLHEAPIALITWEDAIACADTTAADCDYATLFRVYGQMADVYRRQHFTEKQLTAEMAVSQYAKRANDIYNYIRGIELQAGAYYDLGDSVGIFQTTERARKLFLEHGMKPEAAQVYAAAIHFLVNHKHFEQAHALMKVYEDESGLFNEQGEIIPTREQYYYYKLRPFKTHYIYIAIFRTLLLYNLYYDFILQGRNFKFSEKIDERSRIILLVHIRKLDFFYYHTNLILSFDAKVLCLELLTADESQTFNKFMIQWRYKTA